MNDREDLVTRLRALGRRPVDSDVAERHLDAMAGAGDAGAPAVRPHGHRLRIVAAFAVGLLAGTTGLATAGALPDGAQEVAHHALGAVGVNVPHGDRYQGPECGGVVKNHGQYVRSQPKGNRAAAAASRCGKPLQADEDGSDPAGGSTAGPADGCQGPPPWAGKGKPDKAAKAARKQACGGADDSEDNGTAPAAPGTGSPNVTPQAPTTTTTAPPTTETTAPAVPTTVTTAATTTTATTTSVSGPAGDTTSTTTAGGPGGETTTTVAPPASGPVS